MKKLYFKKILIMYSLLLFVLMIVFSAVFFFKISGSNEERVKEQNEILFSDYVKNHEEEYAELIKTNDRLANMESLAAYSISSGTDYYRQMTKLKTDMAQIYGSAKALCFVHKLNDTTCVSNTQSTSLSAQLKLFGVPEQDYRAVLNSFEKSDLNNHRFIYTDMGALYISTKTFSNSRMLVSTFKYFNDAEKVYSGDVYASFLINGNTPGNMRTDKGEDADIAAVMAMDRSGTSIQSASAGEKTYYSAASNYSDVVYYMRAHNTNTGVLDSVMDYLPFIVVTFMISFALILYVSKWLYRPIDGLVSIFMDMQPESGGAELGNDIEYLAGQVSRIRHENSDLAKSVEEAKTMSTERFINSVFNGTYDPESVDADMHRFNLQWLDSVNFVVMAEVNAGRTSNEINANIMGIIGERLKGGYTAAEIPLNGAQRYFIVHTDNLDLLREALAETVTLIDTAFSVGVSFYIGKISKSCNRLYYSAMTIEKVHENRLNAPQKAIYDFSELKSAANKPVIYPVAIESKLLAAVENGNCAEAQSILNYIYKEYLHREFDDARHRDMLVYAFVNTVNRAYERCPGAPLISDPLYTDGRYRSTEQLEHQVNEIFLKLAEFMQSSDEKRKDELSVQISDYIRDNINGDISLISIADHFGFTPNYMSSVFKTAMGENFKDCVSRMRYEAAVRILEGNPFITAAELAAKVGINSTATIIRLFKKYAGVSVAQYAEKIVREKED